MKHRADTVQPAAVLDAEKGADPRPAAARGALAPAPPPIGLGFFVHNVSRLMRRRFTQRAREAELGLTRMEASVLLNVARGQGMSQADLARLLDVEPITLARVLAGLEGQALIERRAHPTDRRVRTVWLQSAAYAMVDRIREITLAVRAEALAGFAEAERQQVFDGLFRIEANLLRRRADADLSDADLSETDLADAT